MITLFCLLQGKPINSAFEVDLDEGSSISRLKKLLKEESRPALDNIAALELEVYKVSIPNRNRDLLQEIYHKLDQNEHDILQLDGRAKVKDTFPDSDDEDMYIIVRHPSKSLSGAPTLLPFSTTHSFFPLPMYLGMLTCCLCIHS
jgi:hypothetical protein